MNLLKIKPTVRDLVLPNGKRIKVEVNDLETIQHVHDHEGRIHATARPNPVRVPMKLRMDRTSSQGRKAFRQDPAGLWAPLPEDVTR